MEAEFASWQAKVGPDFRALELALKPVERYPLLLIIREKCCVMSSLVLSPFLFTSLVLSSFLLSCPVLSCLVFFSLALFCLVLNWNPPSISLSSSPPFPYFFPCDSSTSPLSIIISSTLVLRTCLLYMQTPTDLIHLPLHVQICAQDSYGH